jgi:5-aminolevulinate synthase
VVGGYIAGSADLIDVVRSYAPGFIFTTSLPPSIVAGAQTSIAYQKSYLGDRHLQQLNVRALKARFAEMDTPVVPNPTHIVPVLVGDAALAKQASDMLLTEHKIYVQSINYPTVPVGQERLRITPTPGHTAAQLEHLMHATNAVFVKLGIRRTSEWVAAATEDLTATNRHAQVIQELVASGDPNGAPMKPLWTAEQLGLKDGLAPRTLKDSTSKAVVDERAAKIAKQRLAHLLTHELEIEGKAVSFSNKETTVKMPLKARVKQPQLKLPLAPKPATFIAVTA